MKKRFFTALLAALMALTAIVVPVSAAAMPGDANGDGKLNARDITAIMRYLLDPSNPSKGFVLKAADFNSDGTVNARDITAIMREILEGGDNDFVEAYIEALPGIKKNLSSSNVRNVLAYLDEDNIPELLVMKGSLYADSVQVYAYKNGKVVEVGSLGVYGEIKFISRQNLFGFWHMRNGYESTVFCSIINGKLETVYSLDTNKRAELDDPYFKLNGKDITEEEYNAELKKLSEDKRYVSVSYYSEHTKSIADAIALLREDYRKLVLG